jgi:hypothetical protein
VRPHKHKGQLSLRIKTPKALANRSSSVLAFFGKRTMSATHLLEQRSELDALEEDIHLALRDPAVFPSAVCTSSNIPQIAFFDLKKFITVTAWRVAALAKQLSRILWMK